MCFLSEGRHSFVHPGSIKVTVTQAMGLKAGAVALLGEGWTGEDTKMTAQERRASHMFSLPSPQVRLASLQSEV